MHTENGASTSATEKEACPAFPPFVHHCYHWQGGDRWKCCHCPMEITNAEHEAT